MRKRLIAALLLAILAMMSLTPALATSYMIFPTGDISVTPTPEPTSPPYVYVEFKGDSTVYKKAGSGRTDVVILKGSTAEAIKVSKDKKWVQIYYGANNAQKGWVRYSRLKKSSIDYPLINYASSTEGAARLALEAAAQQLAGRTFKTSQTARVYKTGTSEGKLATTLEKGVEVTATGKLTVEDSGVFFLQVNYGKKLGWVSEAVLRGASAAITEALLK